MPGRPVREALLKAIARKGGWELILDRIEDGETIASISKEFGVSRSFFARTIHEDDARSQLVFAARKRSAEALIEEAKAIVDEAPLDRDALNKAKLQADLRVDLAGKLDRESWGETRQQAHVQVNIGTLHLDALRAQPKPALLPPITVDVESIAEPAKDATP